MENIMIEEQDYLECRRSADEDLKNTQIEESWEEYTVNNFPTVEDIFRRENMQYEAMYLDYDLIEEEVIEQDILAEVGNAGYSAIINILKKHNIL